MDDLNAVQFARRAAQFGHEALVDGVQVALEQGVVAGRVSHGVLVLTGELGVVAIAFAHEDVDFARLQYPIESGQLAEVDLERMRATFLTLFGVAGTVTSAGFALLGWPRVLAKENVLGLRSRSFLVARIVVAVVVVLVALHRILFADVAFDSTAAAAAAAAAAISFLAAG